jgi:hypothetical protein
MLIWCQPTSKKPTTWVGFEYHYYDSNDDKIINQLSELENQHAKVTINGALVDKMAFNCNSVTINE